MGQLNVGLEKRMRAQTTRRDAQPIRKTVNLQAPPTLWQRLRVAVKYVLYATMFVGGFAGGFVIVLYAVQLPGFPRLG